MYKISTGNSAYQDLTFWDYRPEGKLTLMKTSGNRGISGTGSAYSLKGAVYGVYTDEACTKKAGELQTDEEGKRNTLTLAAGTYYVKELKASPGYGLDKRIYKVQVTSQGNESLQVEEQPQYQKMDLLAVKYDSEKELEKEGGWEIGTPQGAASLGGAEFTCRFYGGFYDTLQELQGNSPLKTWVFRCGVDG